jgi:penicillin-binding protein 2
MTSFRDTLKSRFAVFGLLVLVVLGILLVRLWSMQVLAGESYTAQATDNRIRSVTIEAPRGRIFDRAGRPLVTSRPALAVTMEKSAVRNSTEVKRLASILGMNPSEVTRAVTVSKLGPLQARVVKLDIPMKTASYLAERSAEFPGVSVEVVPIRTYPNGAVAAHVLGYVGEVSGHEIDSQKNRADLKMGDIVGKAGAEAQFEKVLRGDRGFELIEVDAKGRPRRVVSTREAIGGRDVVLTIDLEVQKVTEAALAEGIKEAHRQKFPKANAGAAVVVDVKTGEIIAMASAPTYDPTKFLNGLTRREWASLTSTASGYPLNDRAIMSAYPPASTFKATTGLAGLQNGMTAVDSSFQCAGRWVGMGDQWPKWCWDHAGHGTISFTRGVAQSCDTVFYEIGYRFYRDGKDRLQAFAKSSGYGAKTGLDLPGELSGRIPDAKWKRKYNADFPENQDWLPGDTVNMAIGQGDVLATPLQVAQAYAGIANNGAIMQPHVLKNVMDSAGRAVLPFKPRAARRIAATPSNLAVMQQSLRDVVVDGTARRTFDGLGVAVAGKTGTAQVTGKDDFAWFVGYAPADDPKYCVAVLIEQGGHGASVAGPAARMILAKLTGQPVQFVRTAADQSR